MTRTEYARKIRESLESRPTMNTEHITRKWLNIPYTNVPNSQLLDVYLPETGEGPFPVVIYIHGGGFIRGSKDDRSSAVPLNGLERGYAVVIINYTLSLDAAFPTQIYEVKTAIRWVKSNGKNYHIDTTRIALMGASAGAHLAALAGTSGAVGELEDKTMGYSDVDSKVQAVVVDFTPVNFATVNEQLLRLGRKIPEGLHAPQYSSALYLGDLMDRVPDIVRKTNPETYISPLSPSFFIQHGTEHYILPYDQSVHFAELLAATIGDDKVELSILEGVGGGDDPNYFTTENIQREFDFLDRFLNK